MYKFLQDFIENFHLSAIAPLILPLAILFIVGVLLSIGRRLDSAMRLERFGIPIALLVGVLGLILGPFGPVNLWSEDITDIWIKLPTPLLTLVFSTLMLGRPIPKVSGIIQPVAVQAFLALFLGFGQYLVGGFIVLAILLPYFGVDPLMGCLIEVGFEGGHGAAAIMGESFEKLGFANGLDLGLAMATIGLLSSTLLGSGFIIIGRINGWVASSQEIELNSEEDSNSSNDFLSQIRLLLLNLGFCGLAVLIGVLSLYFLRLFSPLMNDLLKEVVGSFPVFPLALLGSLFVRFILEKTGNTQLISSLLQREIGILSTDLLIATAMAGLNVPLLINDWIPLTILALAGLSWNFTGILFFSKFIFRKEWFERSIAEFGNSTGVAASGLLLLRLADPRNATNTLPIFSLKQLFLQPFLSGGLITVVAPLFISRFGLLGWTEICGITTIAFALLSLSIQSNIGKN